MACRHCTAAARDYLLADPRCTGKVGLVGFCMGAGFCVQLAPRGLFDATAPNYGLLPKDIDIRADSCPVVASSGAEDRIVSQRAADQLEASDVPRDVKQYPDVGHSFKNDWQVPAPLRVVERVAGMAYSQPEAEDGRRRIIESFGRHMH